MNLKNKTVWITGASSGIGEALSKEFFMLGATVILSARNEKKLNEKKDDLDAIDPGRCRVVPFDVTKPDEIKKAVDMVIQSVPRLDILVNNAGVSQRSLALETTIEVDRELFETNYFGTILLTKSILPSMIQAGGGHIVVLSSMAGKYGFPMRTAYAASKHALNGFFETLRAELYNKNIRVMLVCPGRISTDISLHALTGNGQLYGKMDEGQMKGVPVVTCAKKIVKGIGNNRKELFIGRGEVFLLVIKRICPALFYWIAQRVSPT